MTIDHDVLLSKLWNIGLSSGSIALIEKCLLNNSILSTISMKNVTIGIPQGSILDPLLVLIYINDIQEFFLKGKLFLFADDCCLFYPNLHVLVILRSTFNLTYWILQHRKKKTKIMCLKLERANVGLFIAKQIVKICV